MHLVGYGAVLFTRTHAQGILELQQCEDCVIEGITFEGYGEFPGIDPVTGYGEKGTKAGGYPTSGFWNYRKNNSFDTSERARNDGKPFGIFGGGFIGNVGSGVLVHRGCKNVLLSRVRAVDLTFQVLQLVIWETIYQLIYNTRIIKTLLS